MSEVPWSIMVCTDCFDYIDTRDTPPFADAARVLEIKNSVASLAARLVPGDEHWSSSNLPCECCHARSTGPRYGVVVFEVPEPESRNAFADEARET